jgi:hypothetical protein
MRDEGEDYAVSVWLYLAMFAAIVVAIILLRTA